MTTQLNNIFAVSVILLLLASCSSPKVNIINTPQVYESYSYPIFLGNDSTYQNFITQNISYPAGHNDKSFFSMPVVNCLYGKDGILMKTSITQVEDTLLKKEVEKILLHIPQSISAEAMPTEVLYVLRIKFSNYQGYVMDCQFPGGKPELKRSVMIDLFDSLGKRSFNIKGRTVIDFMIGESGYPENIELVESISPQWDISLLKIINKMPRWVPAAVDGKKVKSLCRITIGDDASTSKTAKTFYFHQFTFEHIDTSILPNDFFTDFFPHKNKVQYLDPARILKKEPEESTTPIISNDNVRVLDW